MNDYPVGTVAVATVRGVPNVRVMRVRRKRNVGMDWAIAAASTGLPWAKDREVTDVRPLVVLDLDRPDRAVFHLRQASKRCGPEAARCLMLERIAGQIEAQTRPPKPAEPQGLGAVIEDSKGRKWVRDHLDDQKWFWAEPQPNGDWQRRAYGEIKAVKVLSEGVQQ